MRRKAIRCPALSVRTKRTEMTRDAIALPAAPPPAQSRASSRASTRDRGSSELAPCPARRAPCGSPCRCGSGRRHAPDRSHTASRNVCWTAETAHMFWELYGCYGSALFLFYRPGQNLSKSCQQLQFLICSSHFSTRVLVLNISRRHVIVDVGRRNSELLTGGWQKRKSYHFFKPYIGALRTVSRF